MKNFIQEPKNITIVAPKSVISGELVCIGRLIGVANTDALLGESVTLTTEGVFEFASPDPFALGEEVHIKEAALVKKGEGTTKAGICVSSDSKLVRVMLV